MPALPTSPLLGPTISGTTITVDTLTRPVTRIPAQIRDLVAANEGYFAEEIFATPGFTVEGGAIIYNDTFPDDHFLDPTQGIAPRAPGSEAPMVGALRPVDKIARPESLSGKFEVHDETRRRNNPSGVAQLIQKVANSFADTMQSRAIETLDDAITAWGRETAGTSWADAAAAAGGVINVAQNTLPMKDFRTVMEQFVADKAGVRPDLVILNQEDATNLELAMGGPERLDAMLRRYNMRLRETPHQTAGEAVFAVARGVGVIAFEKPLDTEYVREGLRKTDTYVSEATPVFVANRAEAVFRLTGLQA